MCQDLGAMPCGQLEPSTLPAGTEADGTVTKSNMSLCAPRARTRRYAWLWAPDSASFRVRRSGRSGRRPASFAWAEMANFACGLVCLSAPCRTHNPWGYSRRSRGRTGVPAGFQSFGRPCSLWNCSITSDPSIGSPCSSVPLNSRTSPKPWMLTSARISRAWSSVA